jgi:hypothetical protein
MVIAFSHVRPLLPKSDKQRIGDAFNISDLPSSLIVSDADYNVAPTTFQPVIRNDRETGERELVLMRWGLVPFFTKRLSDVKGISTINAKAENVEKSPSWRTRFRSVAASCRQATITNGCDLKVAPMIVRRGHATGPAVPSAVP